MKSDTDRVKAKLTSRKAVQTTPFDGGLSTGLTLLNLAMSGRTNVGILPGHYFLLVGDSQAGKTWLSMTILAEASRNPNFKNYRFIHDNPERGALMEVPRFFGKSLADRLEAPGKSGHSTTLEGFYDNVATAVNVGTPFIYVLDSEDALQPEAEQKAAKANRNARGRGDETKGSYGTAKAKTNSSGLRAAHNDLEQTGSILIVVKQSRDNIGFDAKFNPKTKSGGRALTFYASGELWFSVHGKIRKTARGKPRVIGSELKIHVKKNRISGRDRSVIVPFFPSSGLDETGSLVQFLIEESHWNENKGSVDAPEFSHKGSQEKLVRLIEDEGKEGDLRRLVAEVWGEIEEACAVERKRRYS